MWQLAGPQLGALMRRLWPMQLAGALATVATARWLGAVNGSGTVAALGAALVLYAASGLMPLRLDMPARLEPWLAPLVGGATGVVTVPYLQGLRLAPDALVQALGLSFTVSTVALAAALAGDGAFGWSHAGASLIALTAAFGGMLAGTAVRTRMRPATFRRWLFVGLGALGAHLMLRALP